MAGGSGFSHTQLQKTVKSIERELKVLNSCLAKIQKDVNTMNRDVWNGGQTANKWYEAMEKSFQKDVKFYNKIVTLQNGFAKRVSSAKEKTNKSSASSESARVYAQTGIKGGVDESPNKPIPATTNSPEVQPGGEWQGGFEYYME